MPLEQHRENGREQFRPERENLLGAAFELCLWLHWQRQQGEPRIGIGLLAQLLKAQPNHAIKEGLQLPRQLRRTDVETSLWHHHDNGQMLHVGVKLQEASCLGKQTVLEAWITKHLPLQQHHGLLRRALV